MIVGARGARNTCALSVMCARAACSLEAAGQFSDDTVEAAKWNTSTIIAFSEAERIVSHRSLAISIPGSNNKRRHVYRTAFAFGPAKMAAVTHHLGVGRAAIGDSSAISVK